MFDHPSLFIPVTCQSSQACSTFVGALGYTGNVLTMSINPGVNVPGGLLIGLMQPHAVGQVVLEGERVVVDRGMHSDPRDREMMADAVSQLRELTSDERFRHRAQLLDDTLRGDGWLPRIGEGMWHATGTMRMGDADDAVTDCNGLVRGTKNVWCMDAGIFPRVPPVPIQGPTMVAAQVLADRFVSLVTT
jgi:choline dehydrogenase-like flavoprotein